MTKDVAARLASLAREYPPALTASQLSDVPRIAFHLALALGSTPERWADTAVCDIGGGVGLFSVGCAALGVRRSVLIDDFRDGINVGFGDAALGPHRAYGVEVHACDAIADGLRPKGPFDVVTTFDSMEQWHSSPRRLFADVVRELKPGGRFVLGGPNCVNLRKRISVPLGRGKWSAFEDWYAPDVFRCHVREPDVDDLRRIAADLKLERVRILGRNWLGHGSSSRMARMATRIIDHPLRLRPSLCSDIYLVGHKPG
jgi:SAM-dependent methyltransferase